MANYGLATNSFHISASPIKCATKATYLDVVATKRSTEAVYLKLRPMDQHMILLSCDMAVCKLSTVVSYKQHSVEIRLDQAPCNTW